jgi:hypothetical protein
MLLRHSNDSTRFLAECGASFEEYTAIQPIGSKYDYFRDPDSPIQAVVVIVDDRVYGVFRIVGVSRSGSSYDIASPEYVEFDRRRDRPSRECHYFLLEQLPSSAIGRQVHGWEKRTRTPVQRHDDSFFDEISVDAAPSVVSVESLRSQFRAQVRASTRSSSADRALRLQRSDAIPKRVAAITFEFVRNPDVVAEVLHRANGECERCRKPAPFLRKSDRTPFLEVHHRQPLAQGGLDTVANAEAVCPNCHREAHYGDA